MGRGGNGRNAARSSFFRNAPPPWPISALDPKAVTTFAETYRLPKVVATATLAKVHREGHRPEVLLDPSLDRLVPPLSLPDQPGWPIRAVLGRLDQAINDPKTRIMIVGDYDCDGISAAAIWYWTLVWLGMADRLDVFLPTRQQGYGITPTLMERVRDLGYQVAIVVDSGTTAGPALRRARDLGLDVVVVDHHQPHASLPASSLLANPHAMVDPPIGWRQLAASGLSWKISRALLEGRGASLDDHEALLGYVAIGTVGDMLPLQEENRIMVRHGLNQLDRPDNPVLPTRELRALIGKAFGRSLAPIDLGMRLCPVLNLGKRVDDVTAREIFDFLVGSGPPEARVGRLERLREVNRAKSHLVDHFARLAEQQIDLRPDRLVHVIQLDELPRGLTGLLGNRLKDQLGRPVIVLTRDGNRGLVGSGRAPNGVNLLAALRQIPYLDPSFGGHLAAVGGIRVKPADLARFDQSLNDVLGRTNVSIGSGFQADVEARFSDWDDQSVDGILQLAPFSLQGNDYVHCVSRGVRVVAKQRDLTNAGHPRPWVQYQFEQDGRQLPALAHQSCARDWLLGGKTTEELRNCEVGETVDLLYTVNRDENGDPRLIVRAVARGTTRASARRRRGATVNGRTGAD